MEQKVKMQLAMLVAVVFWAGAFIAGKIGVQEFSPYGLTFFRFFFAAIVIFALLIRREGADWWLERSVWPLAIVLGIVGMFGYHVLFFTALQYTSAVNSSMIGATNPLITTILAAVFLGEYLSWKRIGAILLALSGVLLTVTDGDLRLLLHFDLNMGDVIMLAAVVCWAVYSIIGKRAMRRTTPLKLTAYAFLVCVIVMIPLMVWEKIWLQLPGISPAGWGSVIYMAIFPSVIGYVIQMTSIRQIGASRTAVFINLVPVVSMVLSYFILHESIGWFKVFTAGMIISGVYLSTRLSEKKEVSSS